MGRNRVSLLEMGTEGRGRGYPDIPTCNWLRSLESGNKIDGQLGQRAKTKLLEEVER